jgi:hypothetical protein
MVHGADQLPPCSAVITNGSWCWPTAPLQCCSYKWVSAVPPPPICKAGLFLHFFLCDFAVIWLKNLYHFSNSHDDVLFYMIWNRCGSCDSHFISIGFWYENEKHKSLSLSAMQVNSWQKKISIAEKVVAVRQLEKGEWIVDKWHNFSFA